MRGAPVVWRTHFDCVTTSAPLTVSCCTAPDPRACLIIRTYQCGYSRWRRRAEVEMENGSDRPIGVSPFHSRGALKGFVISGRWPDSTKEWAQLLMVAVRIASLPGLLSTTTVFGAREELPDEPEPGTVGLVLAEGTVFGESAIQPGYFAEHQPPALLMLHPPSETTPSLPECTGAASGCVLLPGLPYLGLEHRAAWVEAEADGTITSMVSRVGVDPISHPDTAILAMLLAA